MKKPPGGKEMLPGQAVLSLQNLRFLYVGIVLLPKRAKGLKIIGAIQQRDNLVCTFIGRVNMRVNRYIIEWLFRT
jgi:hypothetical protein